MKGIGRAKLTTLFSAADAALPGVPNYTKDYKKCENPWEAWFEGTDKDWSVELGISHFMKQHCCVIKLWR